MTSRAAWIAGVAIVGLAGLATVASPSGTIARWPSMTQAAQSAETTPTGNAENGRQLFRRIGCYQCHGLFAQGVVSTFDWASGPRLAPSPMPFQRFARYVRSAPRAPSVMPPYTTKVLPEQGLADIYAFLKSVPPPPALDSIPLLAPSQFLDGEPKRR